MGQKKCYDNILSLRKVKLAELSKLAFVAKVTAFLW